MKILLVLLSSVLLAKEPALDAYTAYVEKIKEYPLRISCLGKASEGEIEILTDSNAIALAAKTTGREIGIVFEDRYWIWINDPVMFPNGKVGVYGRIIPRSFVQTGISGCAVIPLYADGRIALNCNYRHSTRSWELEIPRGFIDPKETAENCARREVLEETGFVAKKMHFLGEMAPDTGTVSSLVPVFSAEIAEVVAPQREDSEAIDSIMAFSLDEVKDLLKKGYMTIRIRGKDKQVFLRDPFLTFGLFQMEIRGLLKH